MGQWRFERSRRSTLEPDCRLPLPSAPPGRPSCPHHGPCPPRCRRPRHARGRACRTVPDPDAPVPAPGYMRIRTTSWHSGVSRTEGYPAAITHPLWTPASPPTRPAPLHPSGIHRVISSKAQGARASRRTRATRSHRTGIDRGARHRSLPSLHSITRNPSRSGRPPWSPTHADSSPPMAPTTRDSTARYGCCAGRSPPKATKRRRSGASRSPPPDRPRGRGRQRPAAAGHRPSSRLDWRRYPSSVGPDAEKSA